jgi:Na+:H+ antiporter, NhaA family
MTRTPHADPNGRGAGWVRAERAVTGAFVWPARKVLEGSAGGAMVMLTAAAVALLVANSPIGDDYERFWATGMSLRVGGSDLFSDMTLRDWVSDGLMAVFFFAVALEIKREAVMGLLRRPQYVALPTVAALGGMAVPALIYSVVAAGTAGSPGWAIPIATDISFAVAVVAAVGPGLHPHLRLFLLTLAIVDDLGGILVIALFYTAQLHAGWMLLALVMALGAFACARMGYTSLWLYGLLAVGCWLGLHEGGVHPTIAGAVFGMLTPAFAVRSGDTAPATVHDLAAALLPRQAQAPKDITSEAALAQLQHLVSTSRSPLVRMERATLPLVALLVLPVFALANAGLRLTPDGVLEQLSRPVTLGVVLGLVLGKPLGVFLASWLACRTGLGRLPDGVRWSHMAAVSLCTGVGFTVSLLIAGLSFGDGALRKEAELGVLVGSVASALAGWVALRAVREVRTQAQSGDVRAVHTSPTRSSVDYLASSLSIAQGRVARAPGWRWRR